MGLYDEHIIKAIKNNIYKNVKVKKYFNFTYKSQKHKIENILKEIIMVIKYAIPWREIKCVPYSTVYSSYKRLLYFNILKNTYIELLKKYFKKCPNKKLKYQYTDTTCVSNKYGSELVKYNGYKKMKCTKISLITDSNGISFNVHVANGTKCDSKVLLEHFYRGMLISKKLNNKNKKFILADGIYYVNNVKTLLFNNNYVYIIPPNKKNKKYVKIEKLTKKEKKIYSKRIRIEHTNNTLKTFRRLDCRYDRNINTFYGSLWIALIGIIVKKM
jgi:hypothetical protein